MGVEALSLEAIEHYFAIDKFDRVVELGKKALESRYDDAFLWYMLGYSNYRLKKYEEAEEQLFQSADLGYNRDIILYILGHIYIETERWKDAEDAFLEALRIDTNDAHIHASYAYLMKIMGHRKKARLLLEKALELDPTNSSALRMYFQTEALVNNSEKERMTVLEQYMQSDDTEISKHVQLGLNAAFQDRAKEARDHFRQAYLLNPENMELLKTVEEMEIAAHPLMAPNRLIDRMGGPISFWLLYIVSVIILFVLNLDELGTYWAIAYIFIAIYTWISESLVRLIRKISR